MVKLMEDIQKIHYFIKKIKIYFNQDNFNLRK
jgi:hypothetical protein